LTLFEPENPNDLSDGLDGTDPNSDEAEDALSSCEEAIAPSKPGYILNVINENKTEEDISSVLSMSKGTESDTTLGRRLKEMKQEVNELAEHKDLQEYI